MNSMMIRVIMWTIIAFALMSAFRMMSEGPAGKGQEYSYSEFIEKAKNGQVESATVDGRKIIWVDREHKRYVTYSPGDMWMVGDLMKYGVRVNAKPDEEQSLLMSILISWGPMLLLIGVWVYFMKKMQGGGGGGAFTFGKSRAKLSEEVTSVTFADVAGCDEAKEEVFELVEFLRDPSKFQKLGGRMPRGILLVGSPGTGKTLLAKAIAGEARVPFLSISGSDFVEMFVGVGAARVRDMFTEARKHGRCILFIDEIDAVGRQRGAGVGGGNDEREQTLNQLLVEMDGFDTTTAVIVIAATNRPDVLDPALLRPGRFDRQVVVPLPDVRGREQILKVHMRKVPLAQDVDPSVIARGTPGFSGADLANLVNEAALFASRKQKSYVDMIDFEKAKEKIIMGAERRSVVMPPEELKNTAYHESGHAIVAEVLRNQGLPVDPVHKVTVIPRGRALGVTMQLPVGDRFSDNSERMLATITVLFAGRIAEIMFMKQKTTGASNDFERATEIARNMVTRYGMSDELGPMVYGEDEGEVFLGRSITQHKNVSEKTMQVIDAEIRKIVDEQYALAEKILAENREKVEAMTVALLKFETLDEEQIKDVLDGVEVRTPKVIAPVTTTPPEGVTPATPTNGDGVEVPKIAGIAPESAGLAKDIGISDTDKK